MCTYSVLLQVLGGAPSPNRQVQLEVHPMRRLPGNTGPNIGNVPHLTHTGFESSLPLIHFKSCPIRSLRKKFWVRFR